MSVGLLESSSEGLRKAMAAGIRSFCSEYRKAKKADASRVPATSAPEPTSFFAKMLLDFLPRVAQHRPTCSEYFALLQQLLQDAFESE